MRTYDFSPFTRSAIGFDRLFDLLNSQTADTNDSFPPYDIVRTSDDSFRISIAVAGFAPADLTITAQQNLLTVTGRRGDASQGQYLHQGISARAFERRFNLADHVEVEQAAFEHGLLNISLVRKVPDAMKPRRIAITSSQPPADKRLASVQAA